MTDPLDLAAIEARARGSIIRGVGQWPPSDASPEESLALVARVRELEAALQLERERAEEAMASCGEQFRRGRAEAHLASEAAVEHERAEKAEATCAMRAALESAWAALGDNLESQTCGGRGIVREYAHAVQSEIKRALASPSPAADALLVKLAAVDKRASAIEGPIAHRAAALLNEALRLDPEAVSALVAARVACNEALAGHPTIRCGSYGPNRGGTVGLLGILNGIVRVGADGRGALAACVEGDGDHISSFVVLQSGGTHGIRSDDGQM